MAQHAGVAARVRVIGLDLGHDTEAAADAWLARLRPQADLVACTHIVDDPDRRVLITIGAPDGIDPASLPPRPDTRSRGVHDGAVLRAASQHAAGQAGRAVIYPGVRALCGAMTVRDILAVSAIERVTAIGGPTEPDPATVVETGDPVRPVWMDGRLTLVTSRLRDGRLAHRPYASCAG